MVLHQRPCRHRKKDRTRSASCADCGRRINSEDRSSICLPFRHPHSSPILSLLALAHPFPVKTEFHYGVFSKYLEQDESLKRHGTEGIELVMHRIVHGGLFLDAIVLSRETVRQIGLLTDLAPPYESRFVEVHVQRANAILLSL